MQEHWVSSLSTRWLILAWLLLGLASAACTGLASAPQLVQVTAESPPVTLTPVTPRSTSTDHPTPSPRPTFTQPPTQTPTTTSTATATPTPVYTILRGTVLVRSSCRYGPGAPYLYKYGLVPGSNLDIIGRNDAGTWILVQAIGGFNPCWVKASLMEIKGDVMTVAPTYIPLPQSPYYGPPEWVQAKRNGNEVTIYWKPVHYRAGDETAEAPYLIEAWICTGGRLVFTPLGVYDVQTKIIDEPGCSEPSHGRLYFVEKHGYSRWIKIPWPEPTVKPS
jgi:hypothetical protein